MTTRKAIHSSWSELAARTPDRDTGIVRLDFSGAFTQGSYAGTTFAGRIEYDGSTSPTDRHCSFAVYEEWPRPVVTIAVGGQVLTAQGAAVYNSVFDGCESHFDFVTMFGTGSFDQVEDAAFFELLFADKDASALDGTQMPTARQLHNLPVKQVSFGTNASGNVISRGDFTLRPAA